MKLTQQQVQHFFLRSGFGANYEEIQKWVGKKPERMVEKAFDQPRGELPRPEIFLEEGMKPKDLDEAARKALQQKRREAWKNLNAQWIQLAATSPNAILEKLTFFWHGHFACFSNAPHLVWQQQQVFRTHGLGSFRTLLHAISKDALMLQFLNNQQNRKNAPNENFAREVMELFTLGRGNYTENDIKQAARAFTGWGFDKDGVFQFNEKQHDFGEKTFFGVTGEFTGEDILDKILERKETARFVVGKIYRFYVSEMPDPKRVEQLAESFYQSNYDIQALLHQIFTADWFYDPKIIGQKIKSPIEFLVGMMRQTGIYFTEMDPILFIQKILGQIIFQPPNVAGWPSGPAWIDSSTLMYRLRLPEVILRGVEWEGDLPIEGDANAIVAFAGRLKSLKGTFNTDAFAQMFKSIPDKDLGAILAQYFLQVKCPIPTDTKNMDRETIFREALLRLMQLPEYQLC